MDFSVFFNHVFFKHVYPILNITQSLHVSPGHQKGFLLEQPLWRSFDFFFSIKYDFDAHICAMISESAATKQTRSVIGAGRTASKDNSMRV